MIVILLKNTVKQYHPIRYGWGACSAFFPDGVTQFHIYVRKTDGVSCTSFYTPSVVVCLLFTTFGSVSQSPSDNYPNGCFLMYHHTSCFLICVSVTRLHPISISVPRFHVWVPIAHWYNCPFHLPSIFKLVYS
jgi:hypothetical protein